MAEALVALVGDDGAEDGGGADGRAIGATAAAILAYDADGWREHSEVIHSVVETILDGLAVAAERRAIGPHEIRMAKQRLLAEAGMRHLLGVPVCAVMTGGGWGAQGWVPHQERDAYLQRLVASMILRRVPPRPLSEGRQYPRALIPLLPAFLSSLVPGLEYPIMNGLAKKVFAAAGTDDDTGFWDVVSENRDARDKLDHLLARIVPKLQRVNVLKTAFDRAATLNNVGRTGAPMGTREFCDIFDALIEELAPAIDTEAKRVAFDAVHGEGTCHRIEVARVAYGRYATGVLGGR